MLDSIGDAVVSADLAGCVTYLNAEAERMTGWSRQDACGQPLAKVLAILNGTSREPVSNPLALALLHGRPASLDANSVLAGRHGLEFAIEDTATPIHDRSGQLVGAVMVFRDVTAARSMAMKLAHLAHHDFLTGLPNRLSLSERLSQAISSADRHRKSLAVMFLDLDGFKGVNDSLGHAIGDQLLQSVSRRLVACVRASDTVSRQGGDEFVVLLAELSRPEDAAVVADKMVASLMLPHQIGSHRLSCPVSIGIGVYPADGTDAEKLLKNADLAMLRAKAGGRGIFRFSSDSPRRMPQESR
jgi:diguanylate cyclase (GGDEF)-like protein/PAS domain S-box-containing protein